MVSVVNMSHMKDEKEEAIANAQPLEDQVYDDKDLKSGLRKVDVRLLPVLGILYLFSYLDRGSLANASIFGGSAI